MPKILLGFGLAMAAFLAVVLAGYLILWPLKRWQRSASRKAGKSGAENEASEGNGTEDEDGKQAGDKPRRRKRRWLWGREPEPEEPEPPVTLASKRAVGHDPNLPGLRDARWLLTESLQRNSEMTVLEGQSGNTAVRYFVDGVWNDGQPLDTPKADAILAALTTVAGTTDKEDEGENAGGDREFTAYLGSVSFDAVLTQGLSSSGARTLLKLSLPPRRFESLEEIGLRGDLRALLDAVLSDASGMVLLSSLPGAGLRTTTRLVLNSMDRLTREVISVEEEHDRHEKIEAVDVRTYSAARGETCASMMAWLFDLDPKVLILRDLDGPTINALGQHLGNRECLTISNVRARDCVEALARVLMLEPDREVFARHVTAVLNQRLIRKLCPACKEAVAAPESVLRQVAQWQVEEPTFFQPPRQPDLSCPECFGLGYRGRTGLFELLIVDDGVREALNYASSLHALTEAAQTAGMLSFLQEGLLLAAAGETSLDEVSRVVGGPAGIARPAPMSQAAQFCTQP